MYALNENCLDALSNPAGANIDRRAKLPRTESDFYQGIDPAMFVSSAVTRDVAFG